MEQWTGYLQLSVENKGRKTIAEDMYFYGAFKLMNPFYQPNDGEACYYIMNPGGGYLDGDRYRMEVECAKQSELLLTTQSATKIYKTPNKPVEQEIHITLKDGSLLEYLPDPIIGYKNARYKQSTQVHMERGTCLIATDIITPGWDSEGNLFSYEWLDLKTEVYLENRLVVFDHIRLKPGSQNICEIGFLEGYSHFGTMLVVGEKADDDFCLKLQDALEALDAKGSIDVKDGNDAKGAEDLTGKIGLSRLSVPGFTLRVLGNSTQDVQKAFGLCHDILRQDWFRRSHSFYGTGLLKQK